MPEDRTERPTRVEFGSREIQITPAFGIEAGRLPVAQRKPGAPDPIHTMEPAPRAQDEFIGVVRELRPAVDPLATFDMPDTSMARALLGPLGRASVGRATIHAPSPEEPDLLESYTTWVPARLIRDLQIRVTIRLDLEAIEIPGHGWEWYCPSLDVL